MQQELKEAFRLYDKEGSYLVKDAIHKMHYSEHIMKLYSETVLKIII